MKRRCLFEKEGLDWARSWEKNYFQSQTKVAITIKNGTNFSAMSEKLVFLVSDKKSGLKLYILYMFINN